MSRALPTSRNIVDPFKFFQVGHFFKRCRFPGVAQTFKSREICSLSYQTALFCGSWKQIPSKLLLRTALTAGAKDAPLYLSSSTPDRRIISTGKLDTFRQPSQGQSSWPGWTASVVLLVQYMVYCNHRRRSWSGNSSALPGRQCWGCTSSGAHTGRRVATKGKTCHRKQSPASPF